MSSVSAPRPSAPRSTLRRSNSSANAPLCLIVARAIGFGGRKIEDVRVRIGIVFTTLASCFGRRFGNGRRLGLGRRPIAYGRPAGQHREQTLRNEESERYVDKHKHHDGRHAQEMNEADGLKTSEQVRQLRKLHRLPEVRPVITMRTPTSMTPR